MLSILAQEPVLASTRPKFPWLGWCLGSSILLSVEALAHVSKEMLMRIIFYRLCPKLCSCFYMYIPIIMLKN